MHTQHPERPISPYCEDPENTHDKSLPAHVTLGTIVQHRAGMHQYDFQAPRVAQALNIAGMRAPTHIHSLD